MPHTFYLRSLRERRGFTQRVLAHKTGLSQDWISRLETKPQRRPSFDIVIALAEALGVDPRRLRFGPDPTPIRRRIKTAGTQQPGDEKTA